MFEIRSKIHQKVFLSIVILQVTRKDETTIRSDRHPDKEEIGSVKINTMYRMFHPVNAVVVPRITFWGARWFLYYPFFKPYNKMEFRFRKTQNTNYTNTKFPN